eukprot:CAMPEP_0185276648 /NCGR_PEP_ID=MMETSP1359-20130426/56649_1 /TAXON_ID=552665 /ORGANISM="Bigelowiella longifila, Strain CCMP242" /LENGTH=187 /DNA_ID=CAMNT_0027870393 /DNA_START=30 /DNA_END=593 /DNA_ORIENTATION=+
MTPFGGKGEALGSRSSHADTQKKRLRLRRGVQVAKSWQAYSIEQLPTDDGEWGEALCKLCERIAMKQNKIFEGIINIKHTSYSWKPKFPPGAYFYRIVKNEEGGMEMWLYSYSHAAPWEESIYQLRVSQAKIFPGKEPLSSTLKIPKSNDKEEKFILSFASHSQKSMIHDLITKCTTHGNGRPQIGE